VVSWVPGLNENDNEDGNNVYSAFPDEGPIPGFPIDEAFLGDKSRQIGETVQETLNMRKNVQQLPGTHRQYRFKNTTEVTFTAKSDRKIDFESPIEIRANGQEPAKFDFKSSINGRGTFPVVGVVFLNPNNPEPLPETVVEEDLNQGINGSFVDFLNDDRTRTVHARRRFMTAKFDTFTFRGTDIEGVRIANLWGAENPYTRDLARLTGVLPGANPIIYSWIDMVVLANGTHAVRIQDATQFPMHTLYTGPAGNPENQYKRTDSGLEIDFDPSASTGKEYAAAINEDNHEPWGQFFGSFDDNTTYVPYKTPKKRYLKNHNNDSTGRWFGFKNELLVDHPMMTYGQTSSGGKLTRAEVMQLLPSPQSPYPKLLSYFSD
jgi:hypothetical protein